MRKKFLENKKAVSVLYDAVLFIVMVSLSGVALIPALQNDNSVETIVDTHRENIAEETLQTLLVSKIDKFTYKSGIQSYEQRHKTFANLIAENLASQKKSFFISDFTKSLKQEIKNFFNDFLGNKYGFSFQAKWCVDNKILGEISFGGDKPEKDCYVAKSKIMTPIATLEDFKNEYESIINGLSADSSDLPSIQKADVKLVLWEVKG